MVCWLRLLSPQANFSLLDMVEFFVAEALYEIFFLSALEPVTLADIHKDKIFLPQERVALHERHAGHKLYY